MGLDFCYIRKNKKEKDVDNKFVYADVRWSYSGFGIMRRKIAKEAKITLDIMKGFCNFNGKFCHDDCGKCEHYKKLKNWNNVKDNIKYFLHHSDCDGDISVKRLKKIVPRLRKLSRNLDEREKDAVLRLCEFMKECIKENSKLIFS